MVYEAAVISAHEVVPADNGVAAIHHLDTAGTGGMGVKPGLGGIGRIMNKTAFDQHVPGLEKTERKIIIKEFSRRIVHSAVVVHGGAVAGTGTFTSEIIDFAVADDDIAAVIQFETVLGALGVYDHVVKDDVLQIFQKKDSFAPIDGGDHFAL